MDVGTESAADVVRHLPFETVTIGTVFSGAGLLAIITLLIKQVGPWRKQATDASDKLIEQLSTRIDKVERQLATERRLHFIELKKIEARHAAQRQLDRHKFNNADANLEALLRILEVSPDKAAEAARQARISRAQQRQDEHVEAAEILKAELAAIAQAEIELDDQEKLSEKGI